MISLFKKDPQLEIASSLYRTAMDQSRLPYFYEKLGVPDTLEGRFDLLALHIYLVMNRLKSGAGAENAHQGEQITALSQKLFDVMFKNLDDNLRQMGVGDLSVARKVRVMAEAFYGRVGVYDGALKKQDDGVSLQETLLRNVYGDPAETEGGTGQGAIALGAYVYQVLDDFMKQPTDRILAGILYFPDPEEAA